jgi:hypothetical protein
MKYPTNEFCFGNGNHLQFEIGKTLAVKNIHLKKRACMKVILLLQSHCSSVWSGLFLTICKIQFMYQNLFRMVNSFQPFMHVISHVNILIFHGTFQFDTL